MSWEDFLELAKESIGEWTDWDTDLMSELLDTGSVIMTLGARSFIVSFKVEETK